MIQEKPFSSMSLLPVQPGERIKILDILRGFAVFGILAVNMAGFASPAFMPGYVHPVSMPWYDTLVEALVLFFAEGKFYTIFSFLFGLGFSVQLARGEVRGINIGSFYPRRLWVLFGLGILHAILLWTGDILRVYALLGFALLAFRKRSNRTLLIWAGFFFTLSFVLLALLGGPIGEDTTIPGFDIISMARAAYTSPSYISVLFFQAVSSLASFLIIALTQGPSVMALFLLGLLVGRSKLLEQLADKRSKLKRIFLIALPIGLLGNCVFLFSTNIWLSVLGVTVGAPSLSAAYMSGIALISLGKSGAGVLAPLGNVGRMALSNYVLQSLICSILFDGFGFGLYEKIGSAGLLGITLLIYLIQIPLSAWWLGRFQFGPLEWIWRSLTYRQRQPMLRLNR